MKAWLIELERSLYKKLPINEVNKVTAYYSEMITERVEKGENIEQVLMDYDIKKIVKEITVESIIKRDLKTYTSKSNTMFQILLLLLSTPVLIPLGVIYLSFIIVAFSLLISGFSVFISGFMTLFVYLIDILNSSLNIVNLIGVLGIIIFSAALIIFISIYLMKLADVLIKLLLHVGKKIIKKGFGVNEKN